MTDEKVQDVIDEMKKCHAEIGEELNATKAKSERTCLHRLSEAYWICWRMLEKALAKEPESPKGAGAQCPHCRHPLFGVFDGPVSFFMDALPKLTLVCCPKCYTVLGVV